MPSLVHFIKKNRCECMCFVLFIVLAVVGFVFHEPSYDEAQAWQIARTASFADMIWGPIPIHEGHPPFWHLLLAGPAKLGVSFQLTVSIVGMLFLLVSGFLLFFKSPFPKWIRCCLPFSFFLFYQYGIIVRPYGLMMMLMWLLALYFPTKDKRPGVFVGLLAALCACHLFGIAIAGGITLAWLWEMKNGQTWKKYLSGLRQDRRFQWMLGLLAWVILIMACITLPRVGAKIQPAALPLSVLRQTIYVLAAMPAEAVLTDLDSSFHTTRHILPWGGLLATAAVGLVLWTLSLLYTPRKKWLYLLLPYVCTSLVMIGYSSCHHVGVMLLIFVWYFWIVLAQQPAPKLPHYPPLLNSLAKIILLSSILLPMAWTANVLYGDYKYVIYPAKEMVEFLKKYNLTEQTIFVPWRMTPINNKQDYSFNTNAQPLGVLLNLYSDRNLFANFHDGGPKMYVENFCPSIEEMVKTLDNWCDKDVPLVLINRVPMGLLYNNPKVMDEYRVAFVKPYYQLWKLNPPKPTPQTIYLFRTLWDKYKDRILADAGQQALEAPSQTAQEQPIF